MQRFLCCLITLFTVSISHAQTLQSDTSVIITTPPGSVTIRQLISLLSNKQLVIFFHHKDVNLDRTIQLKGNNLSAGYIAQKIASLFELECSVDRSHIKIWKRTKPVPTNAEGTNQILIGVVFDHEKNPVQNATVQDVKTGISTMTSQEGKFRLICQSSIANLIVSNMGYKTQRWEGDGNKKIRIQLEKNFDVQNEVVVLGYGNSLRKITTASTVVAYGNELSRGYNVNPVSALQGKLPGVLVTDQNGTPGAAPRIQVRGQQSIGEFPGIDNLPSNEPLILLNYIPWVTANRSVSRLSSAAGNPQATGTPGGVSALKNINLSDIERIEVLKDADATAIYGSRGAHGVVHILTRKGDRGPARFNFNVSQGMATTAFIPEMMNTKQYVTMRRQAVLDVYDKITPQNAPDLTNWDTTRNTNWPKYVFGNMAKSMNLYVSANGGYKQFDYYASAGYSKESSVLPVALNNERATVNFNAGIRPTNRWRSQLSFQAGTSKDQLLNFDPITTIKLVPHAPDLIDAEGKYVESLNGISFANPRIAMDGRYSIRTFSITTGMLMEYLLGDRFLLRLNTGLNTLQVQEGSRRPIADDYQSQVGNALSASSNYTGWVFEPQIVFQDSLYNRTFNISSTLGATIIGQNNDWWQSVRTADEKEDTGTDPESAKAIVSEQSSVYHYEGLFGRLTMDLKQKYYLNLTGRIDGSSRFGSNKRYAVNAAAGMAWLISNEKYLQENWSFLSHAKLRASIGTAGNDNIGDYRYFDTWKYNADGLSYGDQKGIKQVRSSNPDLSWEQNLKSELALDLILWNKVSFSTSYYLNRTSRQIVGLLLPSQAGQSGTYLLNHDAVVQNKGWEFSLQTRFELSKNLIWTTQVAASIPKNSLRDFKDFDNSPYRNSLQLGQSLTVQKGYVFDGVDADKGVFKVKDVYNDGRIDEKDKIILGNLDPRIYGGITNRISYRRTELMFFIEGRQQKAINPLFYAYTNSAPGRYNRDMLANQPVIAYGAWQHPGDQANIQRYSVSNKTDITDPIKNAKSSDLMLIDGSYMRLRSASLSYRMKMKFSPTDKLKECKVFLEGTNLFTITGFKGGDPTIQSPMSVPSVWSITAGISLKF